jgi:hypothetical protein
LPIEEVKGYGRKESVAFKLESRELGILERFMSVMVDTRNALGIT